MKSEWVVGGTLLLAVALLLKRYQTKGAFRALTASFSCIWAAFVAMHFWESSDHILEICPLPFLDVGQQTLAAYWLTFAVAMLPGVVIERYWLRRYGVSFPPLIDRGILGLSSIGAAATTACLVAMSTGAFAPLTGESKATQALTALSRAPLNAYLAVTTFTSGAADPGVRRMRLTRLMEKMKATS